MEDPLLTTAEVAARFGVARQTVHRWAEGGRLPVAQKLPGKTGDMLFRASDVSALESVATPSLRLPRP
jgi:excisionase family DNA binding protein